MASLTSIREALAANLATLKGEGFTVHPYVVASPPLPVIWVKGPAETQYHQAFQDGMSTWTLIVQAFVALSTDIGAQMKLDPLLEESGALSVKALLEAAPTLGGAVSDLIVRQLGNYDVYEIAGSTARVVGAEWTVEVIT